jgi:hypothetical protein
MEVEMYKTVGVLGSVVFAVVTTTPIPASAQNDFSSISKTVAVGDTVFVTDDAGNVTRGRLTNVTPSALRLTVHGSEREWRSAAVYRLERRGDSVKDGARRGAIAGVIIGATLGAVAGATWANSGSGSTPLGGALGLGLVGTGLGVGIGAGMDALIQGRTLVYRK